MGCGCCSTPLISDSSSLQEALLAEISRYSIHTKINIQKENPLLQDGQPYKSLAKNLDEFQGAWVFHATYNFRKYQNYSNKFC